MRRIGGRTRREIYTLVGAATSGEHFGRDSKAGNVSYAAQSTGARTGRPTCEGTLRLPGRLDVAGRVLADLWDGGPPCRKPRSGGAGERRRGDEAVAP